MEGWSSLLCRESFSHVLGGLDDSDCVEHAQDKMIEIYLISRGRLLKEHFEMIKLKIKNKQTVKHCVREIVGRIAFTDETSVTGYGDLCETGVYLHGYARTIGKGT